MTADSASGQGHGYPMVVMHGGPGTDHFTMLPFQRCAGQFTVISYDHRCNGRSVGAPVSSMTWENLTADADALRQELGFARWAVVGHSFGGHAALEYALRFTTWEQPTQVMAAVKDFIAANTTVALPAYRPGIKRR